MMGKKRTKDTTKKKDVTIDTDGIILCLFYYLFAMLRHISIFQIIRDIATICWNKEYNKGNKLDRNSDEYIKKWNKHKPFVYKSIFPEIWLLANLLFGILGIILWRCMNCNVLKWIYTLYAFERIFEIFVYQVNVMFFDPLKNYGEGYYISSEIRSIIMVILNLIEYIIYFTIIYLQFGDAGSVLGAIRSSFNIITGLELSIDGKSSVWILIGYFEAIIGIFMNIICIARFMSLLPSVDMKDTKK